MKNHLIRLLEYIVRKIHFYSERVLQYVERMEKLKEDSKWNSKFVNGSDTFEHVLDGGAKILLDKESILSRRIYEGFEVEEVAFIKTILKKGDCFIDVGSNIGLFTLSASALVGNEGKVIAFEPYPATFNRLIKNVSINGFDNIISINQGLSDKKGLLKLNFSTNGYDAWNSFAPIGLEKAPSTVSVPVTTLTDVVNDLNINPERISLIKIDVEGWEKFVLLGALDILKDYHPVVLVEFTETNTFSAGYMVQEVYDFMQSIGYSWYCIKYGKLIPDAKRLHYPYNNLVAMKEESIVNHRNSFIF